jgi:hypothetical protein
MRRLSGPILDQEERRHVSLPHRIVTTVTTVFALAATAVAIGPASADQIATTVTPRSTPTAIAADADTYVVTEQPP